MEQQGKKGFAIAALVLGIVAICLAFIPYWGIAGLVAGVVGLVLAILAGKSYKAIGEKNGMATAGLVLSIIGLALAVIGFFACTVCVCCANQAIQNAVGDIDGESLQQLADQLSSLQ